LTLVGCRHESAGGVSQDPAPAAASAPTSAATESAKPKPPEERVLLGARAFVVTVYEKPSESSKKLGYLRVGAKVERSAEPVGRKGCKGGWYGIQPRGFVCAGQEATIRMDDPLLRAAVHRPRSDRPLPYRYGFVRSVAPLYLRVPSSQQQYKSEFKLDEHLDWFKEHHEEVQSAALGAPDVAVDALGRVVPGKRLGELGREKNSTELSLGELFGGEGDNDAWPFWLRDGERLIPNVSGFDVPEFAVFADRARRHTGLAFIGSFMTGEHQLRRRFAVTTDLRLAPTTKVKPDSGSPWHGVEITGELKPPFAFVRKRGVVAYKIDGDTAVSAGDLERRSVHKLTNKISKVDGEKYYEIADGRWVHHADVGVVVIPTKFPKVAKGDGKWIQVDLSEQVLVLWKGQTPEYATLVSTGRPAIGDPKTTNSTPRGIFKIYAKHITATMDADQGSVRQRQEEAELAPGDEGYVPTKGDGVYGKTLRRGHGLFKLRDVPYIQYFQKNYAIHGTYWHDVFGIPRSHGCINLAPVDAQRVFHWTEPVVPEGWHGVNIDDGVSIVIHE
jgi:lipoprotein-anchoring transpeptidase ErfK/SrfK